MSTDGNAAIVDGVRAFKLFERRNAPDTWILGCPVLDRFLVVPEPALQPIARAAALLDGSRTTDQVRSQVRDELGADLDVPAVLQRLGAAGLLRDSTGGVPARATEIEKSSLTLFRLPTRRVVGWIRTRLPLLPKLWFGLHLVVAVVSVAALAFLPVPTYGAVPAGWIAIGAVLSLVVHEFSHGMAAIREGLTPESLHAGLYFGYVPIVYLRIPGIYTVPRFARMRVWAAGCAFNATVAVATLALSRTTWVEPTLGGFCYAMALWNWGLVYLNLLPLLPTDGYFLLATATREHNIRARAWRAVVGWIKGDRTHDAWTRVGILAYVLAVAAMLAHAMASAIEFARVQAVAQGIPPAAAASVPIGLFLATVLWRRWFRTARMALRGRAPSIMM